MANICTRPLKNGRRNCINCPHLRFDPNGERMACWLNHDMNNNNTVPDEAESVEEMYDLSSRYPLGKLGYLVIAPTEDKEFPGIDVEFVRYDQTFKENEHFPRVRIEKTPEGKVRALIFDDVFNDDFTKEIILYEDNFMTVTNLDLHKLPLHSNASTILATGVWNKKDSFENCVQDACIECGCPDDRSLVEREFDSIMKNYCINFIVKNNLKIKSKTLNKLLGYLYDLTSFDDFSEFEKFIMATIKESEVK